MIGAAFDAVITSHYRRAGPDFNVNNLDEEYDRLRQTAAGLDTRVQMYSALSLAYEDQHLRVFGEG